MPIYVDEIKRYPIAMIAPGARKCGPLWAHLWTDMGNEKELHRFARKLGLKREWCQYKDGFTHYDVTTQKRAEALSLGACQSAVASWLKEKTQKAILPTFNSRKQQLG